MKNIVLIGMPSCGKSTIGKKISEKLNKPFIDMDEEIEKQANMSIPEIFSKYGEEHFRDIESDVAKRVSQCEGCIISTGGGVIKRNVNIDYLKSNGIVVFIDRDLHKLICRDPNRPLSSSEAQIQKLYEERYDLYNTYCDIKVKNNRCINRAISSLLHKLHM